MHLLVPGQRIQDDCTWLPRGAWTVANYSLPSRTLYPDSVRFISRRTHHPLSLTSNTEAGRRRRSALSWTYSLSYLLSSCKTWPCTIHQKPAGERHPLGRRGFSSQYQSRWIECAPRPTRPPSTFATSRPPRCPWSIEEDEASTTQGPSFHAIKSDQ